MSDLSQPIQRLIKNYQEWYAGLQRKEGSTISVDTIASKVASFYEKMRGVVDWREEHLFRRTAIERVLKRRLFLKKSGAAIAEPFIQELIRGGHFPNETIPETKITEIQNLIDKYVFILENSPVAAKEKAKMNLSSWLVGVAACEIEETLSPSSREEAMIELMMETMGERLAIRANTLPEEEKDIQLYIAVQRALFKFEPAMISYRILKRWFLDWRNLPQEKLEQVAQNINLILEKIEKEMKHPLAEKFYAICEQYDTPYLIIGDVASQEPTKTEEIFQKPELLEGRVKGAYNQRLKKVKARMKRAAFYSTLSIFLTKMLMAFVIEVPLDYGTTGLGGFDMYFNLGLNILVPPLLMFILVLSIRPPSKSNEGLVVMEVMKVVYSKEVKDRYEIKAPRRRGFILGFFVVLFYLASFVASYGVIVWGLNKLNFTPISIIIFLMFISLISFAGVKIRQRAKELVVEREKETIFNTFLDLFSLPIIQVGRWLSSQWTRYNAVAVLFNSLLDMPFQVFVEFLEQWRLFLREKKEKIH
jgi:hypothetical protein